VWRLACVRPRRSRRLPGAARAAPRVRPWDRRCSIDRRPGVWAGIAFLGAVELSVRQVLEAVAELREASLQLVCWELNVQEGEARPAFERAIADGLLERSGVDELYNEVMYALTDAGRRALEGAR
jgi:hypothetical protein